MTAPLRLLALHRRRLSIAEGALLQARADWCARVARSRQAARELTAYREHMPVLARRIDADILGAAVKRHAIDEAQEALAAIRQREIVLDEERDRAEQEAQEAQQRLHAAQTACNRQRARTEKIAEYLGRLKHAEAVAAERKEEAEIDDLIGAKR